MSRKREEACLFCGCAPCECNGPAKKTARKKPVAKVKPPTAPVAAPKKVTPPPRKRVTIPPHAIALHRAIEAFASEDMLRPDTYRMYPDIHPPKKKNIKRR